MSSSWPRRISSSGSASSTSRRYSMTSRGTRPSTASSSSFDPEAGPLRRGGGRHGDHPGRRHGSRLPGPSGSPPRRKLDTGPIAWVGAGRACPAGLAPGFLRRRREGDQGPGVDGPGLRAAGVLLPRDRPQPACRRPVPGPGCHLRRRRGRGPRRRPAHALGPRLGARGRRRGPRPGARRGRRRVPARDQGPPRAEGAGRQGLHRALRRPRGPRGGGGHHGGRPRRGPPGALRGRRRRRRAGDRPRRPGGACWPRRPSATTSGPTS